MLQVILSLDYWFIMIIHVLLCITFWYASTGARLCGPVLQRAQGCGSCFAVALIL